MGIALAQAEQLGRLVADFGGALRGAAPDQLIAWLVGIEDATRPDELALLTQPRYLPCGNSSPAIVLTTPALGKRLDRAWLHPHPSWVVAQLLLTLPPLEHLTAEECRNPRGAHIHPSAVVHPSVTLHPSVMVEAGGVVFPRVVVGQRVVIGAGSVVGRPGFGWAQGPNGLIRIPQLAGVRLEDDVELGALCTVDAGCLRPTQLGAGTKLDAQVHVGHNARLGPGCLVAAQSGFAGSCELGRGVRVGGQSGVADHVKVGDGAQIAAKTGVIRDVPAGDVVAGFPAVTRARWLRGVARVFGSSTAVRKNTRLDGSDD